MFTGKALRVLLAADNEHFAIGQDNAVTERAGVCHIGRPGKDSWLTGATADIDRVGAVRGLRIYRRSIVLIGRRSTDGEDLTYVIHGRIAVHGVGAVATVASWGDRAVASGGDPVCLLAGTRLEHRPVRLREQPGMVVGADSAGRVLGEDVGGQHPRQFLPAARCAAGGKYLPVFVAGSVIPRTAEREHL